MDAIGNKRTSKYYKKRIVNETNIGAQKMKNKSWIFINIEIAILYFSLLQQFIDFLYCSLSIVIALATIALAIVVDFSRFKSDRLLAIHY